MSREIIGLHPQPRDRIVALVSDHELSDEARQRLAHMWEQFTSNRHPGSPIILDHGLKLLVTDIDGRVTVNGVLDKEKTEFVAAHPPRHPEHDRLRDLLLKQLANKWTWEAASLDAGDLLVAVSGWAEDAWQRFETVRGAVDYQWFVWRDPDDPANMHCDQVTVLPQTGEVDCKFGCGLNYYTECQPCNFADDVKQAIIAAGRECPI